MIPDHRKAKRLWILVGTHLGQSEALGEYALELQKATVRERRRRAIDIQNAQTSWLNLKRGAILKEGDENKVAILAKISWFDSNIC